MESGDRQPAERIPTPRRSLRMTPGHLPGVPRGFLITSDEANGPPPSSRDRTPRSVTPPLHLDKLPPGIGRPVSQQEQRASDEPSLAQRQMVVRS